MQTRSLSSSSALKRSVPEDGPAKHFGKPGMEMLRGVKVPLSIKGTSSTTTQKKIIIPFVSETRDCNFGF